MTQPPGPPPWDDRPDQPPPGQWSSPSQPGQGYGGQPGYGQPQYPARADYGQQYPTAYQPPAAQGYPSPAQGYPPAPSSTLDSRLGARSRVRPAPRFSSALAGAAAVLIMIGAYVWSVGYFAHGFGVDFEISGDIRTTSTHGEGRRFLGFGLFLVLTGLGYGLVILRRRGPLATAGTVLSAFGVPAALGFAFLDISGTVNSGDFPINIDAVYLISIVAWMATYVAVPGARSRAVYLAAAAISLPSYVAVKTGGNSALQFGFSAVSGDGFDNGGSDAHTGTVAAVGLVFGLAYYLIAALLDRAGRGGTAVALLVAAFTTTASGIALASDDFGMVGTGFLLVVIGVLVALYGGRYDRRFTTWVWAAAALLGVLLIVAKLGVDRYLTIALLLMAVGAALTVAAHLASGALHEEPDIVEEPGDHLRIRAH